MIVIFVPATSEPLKIFVPCKLAIVCADSDTKPLGSCPLPLITPSGNNDGIWADSDTKPLGSCPLPLKIPLGSCP